MKKTSLLLMVAATLLFSCAKDGKDGLPGPSGATGANGIDGNANVIATNTFTTASNNWFASGLYFYADLTVNAITQDVVNSGAVFVYEQNGANWAALPYVAGILSRSYQFRLNNLYIFYQNTNSTQTTNPGIRTFRVVVIPSSVKIDHVNMNDYEEVSRTFNLD